MARLAYRPEIDGLRAIAVGAVILFHAGIPGFQGGFVGVDVFFVISGYLITGIISADIAARRFSILDFYERRVRRIIPALLTTVMVTLAAGMALFLPFQLAALARSAAAAVAFVSNLWFWSHSGYFGGDAAREPLLHTWSLAVEEQFYLFFPLGMWLLHRLRIPLLPAVLAVLAVSFAAAAVLVHRVPSATFYLLPTRAWELMVGAALALGTVPKVRSRVLREALCALGLTLISWPVFTYSPDTVFPGAAALPPCLGAMAIILAGRDGSGVITRLLGSRPMVGFGLISYSLYLWHWPIFVFSRQLLFTDHLPASAALGGIALAVVLAWASWKWVEMPFRSRRQLSRGRLFAAAGGMACAACAMAAVAASGLPGRFAPGVLLLASGKDDVPLLVPRCTMSRNLESCPLGASGQPTFAVWGDSHAAALGDGIGIAARRTGRAGVLYSFNGCPPAEGAPSRTLPPPDQARCRERNALVLRKLAGDPAIRTVVLVAFWSNYLTTTPAPLLSTLDHTIVKLHQAGKGVVVLAGVPNPGFDVPLVLALKRSRGMQPPSFTGSAGVDARLQALAKRRGARLVSLASAFCPTGTCPLEMSGRPLFFDSNHVSAFADESIVAPALARSGLFAGSGSD